MNDLKAGDSVFDKDNNFIATYVDSLSDFIGTEKEVNDFKKSLLSTGAVEIMQSKLVDSDRKEMYGYRKVCNANKKAVEQVLVKTFDDLSWINVNMNNYTFKKIEKPVKKAKKSRGNRI